MLQNNKDRFLQDLKSKLRYFNYSECTVRSYSHHLEMFLDVVESNPSKLSTDDIQSYLNKCKFTSVSSQNQTISSLKFFWEKVLGKKYIKVDFKRPRNERRLPRVIDKDFLLERIGGIANKKHKAILSMAYSVGLRVSEVINLKIEDIDSVRRVIYIRQAKGKVDRIVPLSDGLLLILRRYVKEYRPSMYLFNGQSRSQYSTASCGKIVKKYLGSDKHFHLLRHASLTSMLESGTDLHTIQKIAGHKRISTTSDVYLHLSTQHLQRAQLPL